MSGGNRCRGANASPDSSNGTSACASAAQRVEKAPAGSTSLALAFLRRVADLLPDPEASAWRRALERAESGENLESAIGLPSDWRRRERNQRLRELAASGLSPAKIIAELRNPNIAMRQNIGSLIRLGAGKLCEMQVRRIVK